MNNFPCGGKRVEQLEMLHSLQQQEFADIPLSFGCRVMALADFVRHGCVIRPVYQCMRYSEGNQLDRRCTCVSLRHLGGTASEKDLYDPLAQLQIRAADEIHCASERDGAFETKRCASPQRVPECESMSGRYPKRQVTSCRKAHCHYPGEVQSICRSYLIKKVYSRPNVFEGPWPTASFFADASILDVPRGEACCSERCTQMRMRVQAVGNAPPASMDAHYYGKGTGSLRQSQVAELAG